MSLKRREKVFDSQGKHCNCFKDNVLETYKSDESWCSYLFDNMFRVMDLATELFGGTNAAEMQFSKSLYFICICIFLLLRHLSLVCSWKTACTAMFAWSDCGATSQAVAVCWVSPWKHRHPVFLTELRQPKRRTIRWSFSVLPNCWKRKRWVHKLFYTGKVPSTLTSVVLVVAVSLSIFAGQSTWDKPLIGIRFHHP